MSCASSLQITIRCLQARNLDPADKDVADAHEQCQVRLEKLSPESTKDGSVLDRSDSNSPSTNMCAAQSSKDPLWGKLRNTKFDSHKWNTQAGKVIQRQ